VTSPTQNYRTPGQLIQELLDARGWSQRVLALVLRMDETGLNKIIAGKRAVDAQLALDLSQVFPVPAEMFIQIQRDYDLAMARLLARPDPGLTSRATLFSELPVSDMVKRGWLKGLTDVRDKDLETALCDFFGTQSVDEIKVLPHAAKKTNVAADTTPAQLAWLYRVRQLADDMLVPKYSRADLSSAVSKLRSLLISPDAARKVSRILTECGVRYVIVESLPAAKIDGVCFWLDDSSPVIGMSLRHDRIDNFWFVLRHELEHVLQEHGRAVAMLDTELEKERAGTGNNIPEEERIANIAAAEFCVPHASLDRFISRKAPFFAERDIIGFARTIGVHPGLVAGQLQHRTGRYDLFRNHLVKIRSIVRPGTTVDGWGDVAPVGA
jgi:HTH-type transcriptional regulator / antitoxin HigA